MRIIDSLVTVALAGALLTGPALGQTVKNGGPKGETAFGTVDVASSTSGAVYTVPADRVLVLTTFCNESAKVDLLGSTLGKIIDSGHLVNQQRCLHFSAGIPIPMSEVLSCDNTDAVDANCLVAGVLTKR